MTIRYAIIGTGMMGQEHIRNLAVLGDIEITAISDTDADMRASAASLAPEARVFERYQDLLAVSNVDAIVIATPNFTHRAVLEDTLATDKPILVEKPLATTIDDARAIKQLVDTRRAPVWVAMEYRYMPPVARLIDDVRNGSIGDLRMLSIREHRFPFLDKVGSWNRFSAKSGGTMVEKCCHFFDLMRLITECEPTRLYASGGQDVNHLNESYTDGMPDIIDNAYVVVDFASGVRACLDLCMFAEASRDQEEIAAVGDEGKIECGLPSSTIVYGRRSPLKRMGQRLPLTRETIHVDPRLLEIGDHHGSTYFQHERFARMVREGGRPEVTVEDGLKAVLMGTAAEQSIKSGMPVDLRSDIDVMAA